jgi:hypothetical protein
MKISGLPVHIQEVHEPFCKVAGIKEFLDLMHSGKFRGPSPRCGGPVVRSGPRWTAGARARRSSPVGCNRERRTRGTRWAAHQGAGGSVATGRRR